MKITKISYLERYRPNMSCGTGYSEPDIFQVICDNGTAKNVWIDIWYCSEEGSISEFYETMKEEFPDCKNLDEAFEMWRTALKGAGACPYFWMNEIEKAKLKQK